MRLAGVHLAGARLADAADGAEEQLHFLQFALLQTKHFVSGHAARCFE